MKGKESYLKVLFFESIIFFLTLGVGIHTASKVGKVIKEQQIAVEEPSIWKFLLNFTIVVLIIVGLSYLKKFKKTKRVAFKGAFIVAILLGALFVLSFYLPPFFLFFLLALLIFRWLKEPVVWLHNLLVLLGLAGAGAAIGSSFSPLNIIILLLIFSIYDIIAVYKTKHMVKMAKEMISANSIIGFVIPQKIKGFKENLKEVKPGGNFMIIGGGDIVFPLIFCSSVMISTGLIEAGIVMIFSYFGLLVSFYTFISQKVQKAIPALPPIALFSILGYLLTLLI